MAGYGRWPRSSWRSFLRWFSPPPAPDSCRASRRASPRIGRRVATLAFSGTTASFVIFGAITAVLAIVAIVVILAVRDGRAARTFAAITTIVSGITALAWIVPALATFAAPTPERATLGARMLLLLLAVAWGLLLVVIIPAGGAPDPHGHSVAPASIDGSERVAWVGSSGSLLFSLLGGLMVLGCAVGVVLVTSSGGPAESVWALAVGALAGLSILMLARVRLSVDRRGVRLVSALLGVPLMRMPLAKVAAVSVEMIDPISWGGWGFRFAPGRRAYVTGRGEGIVVTSSAGNFSAVTIPNAEGAAAVLQGLIER